MQKGVLLFYHMLRKLGPSHTMSLLLVTVVTNKILNLVLIIVSILTRLGCRNLGNRIYRSQCSLNLYNNEMLTRANFAPPKYLHCRDSGSAKLAGVMTSSLNERKIYENKTQVEKFPLTSGQLLFPRSRMNFEPQPLSQDG